MRLTVAKALKQGLAPPKMPIAGAALLQQYGYVSDERKLARDPAAVYWVIDVGDNTEIADVLRSIGLPIVVLQNGWWTTAISPDHDADHSFTTDGVIFWPPKYKGSSYRERVAPGVHVHAYRYNRRSRNGPYVAHVTMSDRQTMVASTRGRTWWVGGGSEKADFHLLFYPDTGSFEAMDAKIFHDPQRFTAQQVEFVMPMIADGYRRAMARPKGEV